MSLLPAPPPKSHTEIKATRRMRWWYEQLADYMMAHPQAKQNDMAAHFGRSASTISVIINSDSFKNYLRNRRATYVEALDQSVRAKMLDVADKGFDLILDRFDKKRDTIPLETIIRTTEMALKANIPAGGPSTVVNVGGTQTNTVSVAVSLEDLQAAQVALRNSQQRTALPEPVEAEFTEVETDPLDDLA